MNDIKSAIKVLTKARDLLTPEGAFIKGTMARNSHGGQVNLQDRSACKFCSFGAMAKVARQDYGALSAASEYLSEVFNRQSLVATNDLSTTTQQRILVAFDFAILMAKDDAEALK